MISIDSIINLTTVLATCTPYYILYWNYLHNNGTYKWWIKNRQKQKAKPKYTIILHQYKRGLRAPSASTCALRLETYLRMTRIPYQTVVDSDRIFIEYNDERIYATDDSNGDKCIDFIKTRFGRQYDLNSNFTTKQLAIARAFQSMCESSIKWKMALQRFIYDENYNNDYYTVKQIPIDHISSKNIYKLLLSANVDDYRNRNEVYDKGKIDLKSLNDYLINKDYICGAYVCDADATLFAYIAQIINHDNGPLNEYITNDCKSLMNYYNKIKCTFWKDWYNLVKDKTNQNIYFYL